MSYLFVCVWFMCAQHVKTTGPGACYTCSSHYLDGNLLAHSHNSLQIHCCGIANMVHGACVSVTTASGPLCW